MGRKCCVPGCNSNYDNTDVHSFAFPKDDRKSLWIKKINRAGFVPTKHSVVCINHFSEQFFIHNHRIVKPDGTVLEVKRNRPILTSDAFPSLHANQPSYLSEEQALKRKAPEERLAEMRKRDDDNFANWNEKDIITSFSRLSGCCRSKIPKELQFIQDQKFVLLYKIDPTSMPKIVFSIKVFDDFTVDIWHGPKKLRSQDYSYMLGKENKCDRWTKLDCLINWISATPELEMPLKAQMEHIVSKLKECLLCIKDDLKITTHINFIIEQVYLAMSSHPSYKTDYLLLCAQIYFSYPSAYTFIRNLAILKLPHPLYLKKLAATLRSPSVLDSNSHIYYLKKKCEMLSVDEKLVSVLIDEIHVNASYSYSGGQIIGSAENCNAEATTVQAFMLTSLFSDNKDIVALVPVKNQNNDELLANTTKVLKILKYTGYTVLCLISDNLRLNRKMFEKMAGGSISNFIQNPADQESKLFFLFDTVHLIKSIRNNWLNLTNNDQTIYFPNTEDNTKVSKASLKLLKDIYEMEKRETVKSAPRLSQKVLYPTSMERQNVLHALNLFHDTNVASLELLHRNKKLEADVSGTAEFISFIMKWWKIVNVKNYQKGVRLNDEFCNPIHSPRQMSIDFLKKFSEWLAEWSRILSLELKDRKKLGLPGRGGKFSNDTHFALKFTTDSLVLLVEYLFDRFKPRYILLGKFQTDSLEARFGQYRQMSGGNYHVSRRQIFESENKLKILSWIRLYSNKKGEFQVKNLEEIELNTFVEEDTSIPEDFYELFNSYTDIEISPESMSVLIYVAGYVAKQVSKNIDCELCLGSVITENDLICDFENAEMYEYFSTLNRGGLKQPTTYIVELVLQAFQIFQKIIGYKYEEKFIQCQNQKQILNQLILEKLELIGGILNVQCVCGKEPKHLVRHGVSVIVNILLVNYTKTRNNTVKSKSMRRKLETVMV